MLKNYFIIAFRNFWRNKIFSLINVLGLSIGISAALVIYLIVHFDFSFDKFQKDRNRIYRVVTDLKSAGNPFSLSGVPSPMPTAVEKEITGIDETVGFQLSQGSPTVASTKSDSEKPAIFKRQTNIIFANPRYFNLIPYQWLAGSPEQALKDPFKVVLSEQRAKLYFPSQTPTDIIGKQIIYQDSILTTVSGVVKELTDNTDFIFKEFISIATIPASGLKKNYSWTNWEGINSSSQLFVKLAAGRSTANIEAQLKTLIKKYRKAPDSKSNSSIDFRLQPLSDLHFNSTYGTFGERLAHKPTLYGLLAVAAFLLLLGCINFINLTTAQASQRAKEIGIRKTMGGSKKQLIFQFLSETFLITITGTLLSILLIPFLLKVFGDFIPKGLHFDLVNQPDVIMFLLALVLAVTVLSGSYPALILSRYRPATALKNQAFAGNNITRKAWLRKS